VAVMVSTSDLSALAARLEPLPQPVTSFGAAVLNDSLYMYGGHTGSAHSYSQKEQSNELTRLNLKTGQWETVIDGPHLQGLALVAHGGKLYRIGGFTAMNAEGEDHNLQSQNLAVCFDPATDRWSELPALPERRSSHDAAVVGDSIYVVGGWALSGEGDSHWHDTAWKLDLSKKPLRWQPIASPPFKRRALATAAHDGKLYAVGGMQDKGGPTTAVAVYDPATNEWSEGPSLFVKSEPKAEPKKGAKNPGRRMSSGSMAGFGASAFATGGSLYVTTVQGNLQRLSKDGAKWEVVSPDVSPRFFHRLLSMSDKQLIVVGGSNMSSGKFEEVEVLNVDGGT
jgi:N-acetylneuraminic acid mutarotase